MSEVTVIMGVRDGGPLLVPAVRSILSQVGVDLQLFVMDDGSTDGTAGVLATLAAADSRLTVYTQENQGLGRSLNTLCAKATSPFVARMDADDLSLPWRLKEQVTFLKGRPEVGAVGCWTMTAIDDWRRGGCACYPDDDTWIKARLRGGHNVLVHSSMMMRRPLLAAMSEPYRFRYVQDYDLWLRLGEVTSFGMVTRVGHVTQASRRARIGATTGGSPAVAYRDPRTGRRTADLRCRESDGRGHRGDCARRPSPAGYRADRRSLEPGHPGAPSSRSARSPPPPSESMLGQSKDGAKGRALARSRVIAGWRTLAGAFQPALSFLATARRGDDS